MVGFQDLYREVLEHIITEWSRLQSNDFFTDAFGTLEMIHRSAHSFGGPI
jgi:quercetin dioxygenase-like cupin family protein